VGGGECGELLSAAAEIRGWYVLLPQDELEALAMYCVYYPDICVIDWHVDFADEAEFHLRSIDAALMLVGQPPLHHGVGSQAILDAVAAFFSDMLPVE
jgi:hypothetical protein